MILTVSGRNRHPESVTIMAWRISAWR